MESIRPKHSPQGVPVEVGHHCFALPKEMLLGQRGEWA